MGAEGETSGTTGGRFLHGFLIGLLANVAVALASWAPVKGAGYMSNNEFDVWWRIVVVAAVVVLVAALVAVRSRPRLAVGLVVGTVAAGAVDTIWLLYDVLSHSS